MEMTVRAKFKCLSVRKYVSTIWYGGTQAGEGFLYAYEFQVVTGDTPENKEFFGSTPGGSLTIAAVRHDLFVPGQSYYLDFTPEVGEFHGNASH